jgi:hypothetical protein
MPLRLDIIIVDLVTLGLNSLEIILQLRNFVPELCEQDLLVQVISLYYIGKLFQVPEQLVSVSHNLQPIQ